MHALAHRKIIADKEGKSETDVEKFLLTLRVSGELIACAIELMLDSMEIYELLPHTRRTVAQASKSAPHHRAEATCFNSQITAHSCCDCAPISTCVCSVRVCECLCSPSECKMLKLASVSISMPLAADAAMLTRRGDNVSYYSILSLFSSE